MEFEVIIEDEDVGVRQPLAYTSSSDCMASSEGEPAVPQNETFGERPTKIERGNEDEGSLSSISVN